MKNRIHLPMRPPIIQGAKKKGQQVTLQINGRSAKATLLGWGRFTNTFLVGRNRIIYFTYYGDYSKEILFFCNKSPKNPHIPKIISHGFIEGPKNMNWDIRVYESELYEMPIRKAHGKAWEQLKELESVRGAADVHGNTNKPLYDSGRCYEINRYVADNAEVPLELSEALYELVDLADNYGPNCLMEHVWPRNYGIDTKGRLILVDPFYDAKLWRYGYEGE